MRPVVGIRANADANVGFGHVRRCASLAEALLDKGADVVFFTNPESNPSSWLPAASTGKAVVETVPAAEAGTLEITHRRTQPLNVRALVVDSYDVKPPALARAAVPVAAILDAAPTQAIPAALIVNGAADAVDISHPIAAGARALLGPRYILLRREFSVREPHEMRHQVSNVLVMTGGADATGLSLVFVDTVRSVLRDAVITVVAGPYFGEPTIAALKERANTDEAIRLVRDPASVRSLMRSADLAVTAGGQTTYELAATGVPACAVRVALNQTGNLAGLRARDAILWVGDAGDSDLRQRLEQGIRLLAADVRLRQSISSAGQLTVDGQGAARVADAVLELCA